jgi:hypothetical protein
MTKLKVMATEAIMAITNSIHFEKELLLRVRPKLDSKNLDYEWLEARTVLVQDVLKEALSKVFVEPPSSIAVRLTKEGKRVYSKTPDRKGYILSGKWPEAGIYKIKWAGARAPEVVNKRFLELDEPE